LSVSDSEASIDTCYMNKKSQSNSKRAAMPPLTARSPHWLQRDAQNSLPKLPLPFGDLQLHLIHPFSTDPTLHPERHPDPISRFITVHHLDKQTHRQMGQATIVYSSNTCLRSVIPIESDAANNVNSRTDVGCRQLVIATENMRPTEHC